jgi:hypothetical protein
VSIQRRFGTWTAAVLVALALASAGPAHATRASSSATAAVAAPQATVILDVLLIPRYGAMGAAFASATTYLLADGTLVLLLLRMTRQPASGSQLPDAMQVPTIQTPTASWRSR